MELKLTLIATALLSTALVQAQEPLRCGTDKARQLAIAADPHILDVEAEYRQWIQDYIAAHAGDRDEDTTLIIPVVFHVIHLNGAENISDDQIYDALRVMNEDFNAANDDISQVCCGFEDIIGNINVEFRLATKDPVGNCTNGIDRIRSVETFQGDNGSKLNLWYRDKYLNIWTVSNIGLDGAAAYSQHPSGVAGGLAALADGVISMHDYVGSNGTSNLVVSHTLSHEVGHYLDLDHCWGGTNDPGVECGDDGVDDTPVTKGWGYCPLDPEDTKVCDANVYENYQNFMEYSFCEHMFTEGQKVRMRAALANSTSGRSNLWSAENLAFTGTDGLPGQLCSPLSDFYPEDRFVCQGGNIRFFQNHTRGAVDTYEWTFQDGTPGTSNAENPQVSFNTSGWKTVTLTVTNTAGTDTKTDNFAVLVTDGWPERPGLLSEGFEDPSNYYQWVPTNWEQNFSEWLRVEGVAHTGNACVRMNGYNTAGPNDFLIDDGGGDIDELVSPSLDLSNLSGMQLHFSYAYATQTGSLENMTEKLELFISSDCGESWTLRTTIDGEDLITNGASGAFYVPTGPDDWQEFTTNLGPSFEDPNVRLKFRYTSSGVSNNLYIDDINISGVVSVPELGSAPNMAVYPNPTSSTFSIDYALAAASLVELSITDMSGRVLHMRTVNTGAMGHLDLNAAGLGISAGSYLVNLRAASGTAVQRFTVQ